MITGKSPFLTGESSKDSEIRVFGRITAHKVGAITFPSNFKPSPPFTGLINGLLEPRPATRYGSQQLRGHQWFRGIDWEAFEQGTVESPHKAAAEKAISECMYEHQDISNEDLQDLYLDESFDGDKDSFKAIETITAAAASFSKPKAKELHKKSMAAALLAKGTTLLGGSGNEGEAYGRESQTRVTRRIRINSITEEPILDLDNAPRVTHISTHSDEDDTAPQADDLQARRAAIQKRRASDNFFDRMTAGVEEFFLPAEDPTAAAAAAAVAAVSASQDASPGQKDKASRQTMLRTVAEEQAEGRYSDSSFV